MADLTHPGPTGPEPHDPSPPRRNHLSYAGRLAARNPDTVDLVIIHCTELPDIGTAREYGERIHYPGTQTGNSGHYYVDRDGVVEEWVPVDRVAHHCRGFNERSIGIELVHRGRYPDWYHSGRQDDFDPYPDVQIGALGELLVSLTGRLGSLAHIAGHEDLDTERVPASDDPEIRVRRKVDPGPTFPWERVLGACDLARIT